MVSLGVSGFGDAVQRTASARSSIYGSGKWTYDDLTEEPSPFQPRQESAACEARAWNKAGLALRSENAEWTASISVAFRDLNAYGFGVPTDYQQTVGNVWLGLLGLARKHLGTGKRRIEILRSLDGIVEAGEMLAVLGPPGSGCTTFLKTISGETHGFNVDDRSILNYQGELLPLL